MKIYDMKIGVKKQDGKTFWKTIGSVFLDDSALVIAPGDKPAGFTIDFPEASGIIVPRETKSSSV